MKRSALALAAACLALAGCGSTAPTLTRTTPAPGHPCNTADQVMQCVLPPAPKNLPTLTPSVQGGDFGWSDISASQARSFGWKFGASYLSSDPVKNWTRALVDSYHAAGLATVPVWEASGTAALDGCAVGAGNARQAAAELAALGAPAGQPFDMAIDFDATGPDVAAYFHCASLAEPGRVNAYGGYRPLAYLHAHGDVGNLNWQTYAWSGGLWLPASIAPLEQYLNGSTFDQDRAVAPDYAQWPYTPPGPSPSTVDRWRGARNASFSAYHVRRCTLGQADPKGTPRGCPVFAQRVVYFQRKLWTKYPRWSCWGKHARTTSYVCWIARPTASVFSHERDASERAYLRGGCDGPANFPAPSRSRFCRVLRQRRNYFAARVKRTRALA